MVRVTDDTQAMTVRLPRDIHEWLRRESYETRAAMNDIILAALADYRTKHETEETDR